MFDRIANTHLKKTMFLVGKIILILVTQQTEKLAGSFCMVWCAAN